MRPKMAYADTVFDKYAAQPTAPAVHKNANFIVQQDICRNNASKLAALVCVEDIQLSMSCQDFL